MEDFGNWKAWAKLALQGANVLAERQRVMRLRERQAAERAARSAAERKAAEQAAAQALAEEEERQRLTLQARQLEGRWVSPEQKLECVVTQPDLVEPSIVVAIEDSLGRVRVVAPVHLRPNLSALRTPHPHEFVAASGQDLNTASGSMLNGDMAIDSDSRSFTVVLYQKRKSPDDVPKEGLRATFVAKRSV